MARTSLRDRILPNYTRGEELFHMISHIAGAVLGIVALLTCVIVAAFHRNIWGVVTGCIYGVSVIALFVMSSIYHGLQVELPKKVFQILDHCTIFLLIAGTYTPILLCGYREADPAWAWALFGVVWAMMVLGTVLNSVDLKRFKRFSLICYLGMGWSAMVRIPQLYTVYGPAFVALIAAGGLAYTAGAVFYVVGRKRKFMHAVFHLFVDIAALLHFIAIAMYVMPG